MDINLGNPALLKQLFQLLHLMVQIFYSLSSVDLPEYFEDHMAEWMAEFHKYLIFETQHTELTSKVIN